MYDVCVIGAGPAGTTLARLIGGRLRVLLADARQPQSGIIAQGTGKPCGGLLAPAAQRELARQGLYLPAEVVSGPQLFAVRALDVPSGVARYYQRHYLNIDRTRFDRWLASLVPGDVETLLGWRADAIDTDRYGHTIRFTGPNGVHASARARLVVGADGAASFVRRALLGHRPSAPRYVSIQGEFEPTASDAYYGAVFAPSLTDYYGWTVPKAGSILVGGACVPGAGTVSRFDELVRLVRAGGAPAGPEVSRVSAPLLRPSHPRHIVLAGDRVALVGEAAGLVSPSSGEGISYALRSGAALARALESGLDGAEVRYRREAAMVTAGVAMRMGKSSVVYSGATRRAIMRSGLGSVTPASARPLASEFGYR